MGDSAWVEIEDTELPRETASVVLGAVEETRALALKLKRLVDSILEDAKRDLLAAHRHVEELEHAVASSREGTRALASNELRAARTKVADTARVERLLRERSAGCLRNVQASSAALERDGRELAGRLGQIARKLSELGAGMVSATELPSVVSARASVTSAFARAEARQNASLARLESTSSLGTPPAPLSDGELRVVARFADDAWSVGMQGVGESLAAACPPSSLPRSNDLAGREQWCRSVFDNIREHMAAENVRLSFFDRGSDKQGRVTAGGFVPPLGGGEDRIEINRRLLAESSASDLVGTIVHELRHAEQQRVIDGRSHDPLVALGRDRRAAWRKAADNYSWEATQGSSAHALYLNNPLELDAFACEAVAVDAYEAASQG